MRADQLRRLFLGYFFERGHKLLPSSSLVPKDPTLLFTSAGMVQFKDLFWGRVEPTFRRATTCQKCFRTTDIENVGKTAFHHTFFEMLGNFSFGDYFKEAAIQFAWEFVTQELSIPKERLWVSVYEEDDEAYAIWKDTVGIPSARIVRLGKEHNWWGPVGTTGPCGPDSEIFYDAGKARACGPDCAGVACTCGRFSEIWNLVFMQYEAREDGSLVPLKKKNIDTGMGLERTSAVLQGVATDFEIDLFGPIVEAIERSLPGPISPESRIHRNVIADHVRGAVFLIGDGVFPDRGDQGYVLRRILRRAIRAGEKLELPEGVLKGFVESVVGSWGARTRRSWPRGPWPSESSPGRRRSSARPSDLESSGFMRPWRTWAGRRPFPARSRSSSTTPTASRLSSQRRSRRRPVSRSTVQGSSTAMAGQRERSRESRAGPSRQAPRQKGDQGMARSDPRSWAMGGTQADASIVDCRMATVGWPGGRAST